MDVKEKLHVVKKKVLNNDRIIKVFAFDILTRILFGNHMLFFKINNNFISVFLHVYKIKVI